MIHLSLNLELPLAARLAFGKSLRRLCQVFVPVCYVWPKGVCGGGAVGVEGGVPGPSPPPPLSGDDNDKWGGVGVERAGGRVVENPLQIRGLGSVELIQCVAGKSSLQ